MTIKDNTRNNELLIETEDHIRSLERSVDALNNKIADTMIQGSALGITHLDADLVGQRDRLRATITANRLERGLLIRRIAQIAHANFDDARRLESGFADLVECDCGHECGAAMVMSASMGTSCPDCYDTLSD
jgi:hypothetical protein